MYGNGRPLGLRKRMQIVVAVVLLAWATQTLLHQWGYCRGAEAPAAAPATAANDDGASEKFVPGSERFAAGATLELRGDATILGADVKLKQLCRWSDADAQVFLPVADLVIARIGHGSPFRSITVEQIRNTLHDAGMNLAVVKFAGPLSCTVTRSDASYDEQNALRQWAEAREPKGGDDAGTGGRGDTGKEKTGTQLVSGPRAEAASATVAATGSATNARGGAAAPADDSPAKTLRALLVDDLSVRLEIPKEQLEVTFNPADEKLLNLSEPLFKFTVQPRRARDLGEVSWNVTVLSGGRGGQKGTVTATARAWRNEVVLNKPLAYGQVIQPDDVAERRILSDQLPSDPLLARAQVVGQQASRDLKVGTVMNARLVDAVPLVKPGQLVTVLITVGSVRVKTVGRAMEGGSYGQAIKVRNETTKDVFEVVLTGPQQGTMDPLPPAGTNVARSDR